MRRRSCELALLGLTWLGYVLQIFLVALSALWVNIGVASAGPVREMIPNPEKKYSVGENAGFKLDDEGGIEIHIAAEKPEGVPKENWLPINRGDEALDIVMRLYAPDAEKMETWTPPKADIKK